MTPIVIELLGEPRGKGRPRFTRAGIAFTPTKTRSYETRLAWAAQTAMRGRKPLEGALQLVVTAFMPIPTSWSKKRQHMAAAGDIMPTGRPDIDNIVKSLDGLNGIAWRDDSQIVTLSLAKRYSGKPRLVVTITQVAICDIAEVAAA